MQTFPTRALPLLALAAFASPGVLAQDSSAPADSPGVVCLKLTLQCFERARPAGTAARPIDLSAPDVRKLIPADQLQAMMTEQEETFETENSVKVEARPAAPQVPPGFAGIWWALKHPSQAWRLFAPVQ
ncbi:MAG TPA: hypothetical protein VIL32_05230 [Steroidobacteraceae bacterium]